MRRLNLLVLRSTDIDAARRFYELFGFAFGRHAHGDGPEHYACEDDGGVLEIYPATEGHAVDAVGLGFECDDLQRVLERLVTAGHAPQPIQANPWGRTFVVRDPDGRRVEAKAIASGEQRR
jgi:lactoylglutathione lyase